MRVLPQRHDCATWTSTTSARISEVTLSSQIVQCSTSHFPRSRRATRLLRASTSLPPACIAVASHLDSAPQQRTHNRSRLYSFVTLISFSPNEPSLSEGADSLLSVTKAAACGLMPGIHCEGGALRFDVDEPLLCVRNFIRRRPMPPSSVGSGGVRRHEGSERTLGTQQQTIPTATSIGEKQIRHHDAPIGSSLTLPKTSIAQSIRRTARMVQLCGVSKSYLERVLSFTYKHPRRNKTITHAFFLPERSAAAMAGIGAKRMTLLKKTCSDPMMMHDFLLCSLHSPGGWHMLIQPANDQMYQIAMSAIDT